MRPSARSTSATAPDVFRFLERLLGDPQAAEEALQDTFVRLHRGLDGYDGVAAAGSVPVPHRAQRRDRRAPGAKALEGGARGAALHASTFESVARRERAAAVEQALEALAPEHRAVIVFRLVQGLKLEEIAEALSCTTRTARNRLRAGSVLLERELRRRGVVAEDLGG